MIEGNFYIALVGLSESNIFCSCHKVSILQFLLLFSCKPRHGAVENWNLC